MDKLLCIFLVASCTLVSAMIKIHELKVPEEIEHGSNKDVVLDCDFEVQDSHDGQGLEIKWFYADGKQQIYQWIPETTRPPQAMGILKDRVDLQYKVSDDVKTMHRALKIKNITPELSGEYTCKVSSYYSEDTATKKMIIYEPAKEFDFVHVEESDTYVCSAYGIFPKPVMNVYASGSNLTKLEDGDDDIENDVESNEEDEDVVEEADGLFNITTSFSYIRDELTKPTEFICDLKIPDTNYHKTLKRIFYPGGETTTSDYEHFQNSSESENSCFVTVPSWTLISSLTLLMSFTML